MSSAQGLRDFISARLSAAAVEIFSVFELTIVRLEEEIERQHRLLDINLNPAEKIRLLDINLNPAEKTRVLDINLNPADKTRLETNWIPAHESRGAGLDWIDDQNEASSQQHACKDDDPGEEVHPELHPENCSSLDQEETKPPHMKEEEEELSTSHDRDQLLLQNQTDAFLKTASYQEIYIKQPDIRKLLYQNYPAVGSQDQKGLEPFDSELSRSEELRSISQMSESQSGTVPAINSVKCDFCGKAFKKTSIMKRHQRIHTGEKTHSCEICGKGFRDGSVLLRHMRIHTGEKPYKCETCGKGFTDSSVLLRHMRIHTDEKPYECKTCKKSFKDSSALLRHMIIHSDEKLHSCGTCGKKFNSKTRLSNHMKIHTSEKPYSCKMCGKSFKFNFKLSYHEKAHADEKFCLCNTCGKTFTDPSSLKRHMRIHTEEKPYACRICSKSFRDNYKLLYHMKTHIDGSLQS